MAEAAALSLATDAATAIGQVLMGRTIEEMKLVWGLKDDLEKLKTKYSKLQLFLNDMRNAKHADMRSQVEDWVLEVKNAVYVADDIMDDYGYEIIRREREQKKELLKQFRDFFSRNNNPIVFRIRMSRRVSAALAKFDELDKSAKDMDLRQVEITKDAIAGTSANNHQGSDRLSQARKHASANATEFVGREDEKKKLLEILCRQSNDQEGNISTVAILGLGGLGKTTFARCLYDSTDIEAHFEKKLWISVSDNFSIQRILNEMLEYVASNNGNLCNIDAIIMKLQENLKNKKYLLVLDDIWCKDQELWSSLKNALQRIGGLPGCLILITTRLIEVTTRSRAETHLLRELSEEEGWDLLKHRVSLGGTSPNFSILEEIGKKIVTKCQGVPLAIKAIGGILQSKQLPHEWELIEKSEIWDLPQNDENQILPSLRLTFDHLPSPALKQCFAYCATFCPRGNMMKKDELVDIWLAQGFLHESETKKITMEEIGENYIMVLQNYSLLNGVMDDQKYEMHDLVYDLAVDVCGKDLLFWKQEDHQKIYNCRHLFVATQKDVGALSQLPTTKTLGKLRTLSGGLPRNVLAHAKYLRTLSVDDCDIEELPSSIGLLKHLRYLSLSYNPIKTLPDSIGKLYLLQTLRLLDCFDMTVLPAILYRLTNLIHIPTTSLMLASRGLQELTNLHTLPCLALGDDEDGWSIDELGGLQNLMGEIHIFGLEQVKTKENARKADLAGKAKVSNIILAWAEEREEISGGSNDEEVLDGLQPHPNITSLELHNFFGLTLPSWMVRMPLKNVTSLKLVNCSRCKMLPKLGHLPSLKFLVLSGLKVESIGNDFYAVPLKECSVSFPSLTELDISEFDSLKTWVLPSTGEETIVFPRLEVIELRDCPELETIPALDYFQSLKKLQLSKVGIQSLDITKHKTSSMLSSEVNLKLETLEIYNCEQLLSLPSELQYITSLKTIKLTNCPALTSLPNNIPTNLEKRTSLATFTIEGRSPDFSNSSVKTVNHVSFPSLIELEIYRCGALKTCLLPPSADSTNVFPRLEVLQVKNCPELETLPTLNFQSLKNVLLHNLGIRSFSIASPTVNMKLEELRIDECEKLLSLPSELQYITSLKTMKLTNCHALTSLPNNIPTNLEKRTSLATFTIEGLTPDFSNSSVNHVSFPSLIKLKISDCGALKTCLLPPSADATNVFPRLDVDGWSIDELGVLHKLMGEIHISGLESVKTKENARKADLGGKAKVSNITLAWAKRREEISGGSNDEEVLDGLQPHPNIISLELQNFFGLTLPSWMAGMAVVSKSGSSHLPLKNVTSLKLVNCSRCKMLPKLGHLPSLKFLVLSGLKVESIGNDFYAVPLKECSVSFPSLTELDISEFDSLKTWVLPSTGEETIVFPRLEVIELRDCPELETIPALDYFQSLKKLQLSKVGIQSLDITKHKTSSMLSSEVNLKLETLEIYNCEQLLSLPSELQYITSLKTIKLTNCPALTSLPNNIPTNLEKRTSLATFTIEGRSPDFSNSSVKTVNHVSFPSLIELEIYRCGALKTCLLPPSADSTNVFPRLEVLQVKNCPELETLPTLNFQSLKNVLLHNLGIRSFSIASPTVNMKLEELRIDECEKLLSLPSELQYITSLKTMKLTNCHALTSLPNNIPTNLEKRTSLATFTIEGLTPDFSNSSVNHVSFPSLIKLKISDCGALKTCLLPPSADATNVFPRLDVDGWSIDELGVLHKLMGEIHISGLESVKTKENARKADLGGKAKVSNITLAWAKRREEISGGSNDEEVLDGLQPHPNIISLELQNFFGLTLPSWMAGMAVVSKSGSSHLPLKNVTSLKLVNCSRCKMLPKLGHLPSLKFLVLSGLKVESIGNDFYAVPLKECSVSFPSLTELDISEFDSLKTWVLPSTGEETIVFPRLEVIELRDCPELETIPALDYFQSLKKLQLSKVGIQSLDITKHKTSSMLSSEVNLKLETLEIYNCEQLLSLPSELQYITSLKTIKLRNCPALTSLPNNIPTNLEKRTSLATFTVEGPTPDFSNSSVNHVSFPSLIELEIYYCGALKTCLLPPSADATNVFPHLEVLRVINCPELETLPTLNFQYLKNVQLSNLGIRSFSIASPTVNMKLETLDIYNCEKLVSLPRGLQFVASLKTLTVSGSPALTSLPDDLFHGLASLSTLYICECEALSNIPTSLVKCASLSTLAITECPSVNGPTPDFSKLTGLQLMIKYGNATELMISMLKAVEHLPNLTKLATGGFKDEVEQEKYFSDVTPIQRSQSLKELRLNGNPNIKSLPEQLQLLTQIKKLDIWNFDDLEELPEWVGHLSSLEELWLGCCKKLKDIPSKEVFLQMTRLRRLFIWRCPILAESCVKDGSDWSKISHIPVIEIDTSFGFFI